MMPVRNNNQNWFPSIFNDFFDNDWVAKVNTATPAVNVIEDDKKKYLRREFSYSKFQQSLVLPDNVEKDKISATVNDGVLAITLPKMTNDERAKLNRAIEIQ